MTKIIQPSYTTKLPSNNKTVTFRPFTVKEEKALLLALQENDLYTVANTIRNTVLACTDGQVDPDKTAYYDTEYLFLQIRSKSIGEDLELVGKCDCGPNSTSEFTVDVTSAKIVGAITKNTFKIPETIYTVSMRHPTLIDFVTALEDKKSSGINSVASCITSVYSDEEVYDWSDKEKLEFVESMSPKQQREINAFIDAMPTVQLDASFVCVHCGKKHTQQLSGFENFFV